MNTVEIAVDAHALLGEGPCWDERTRVLWWVDIRAETLHCYDPHTELASVFTIRKSVSAVVPRRSGGLVLAVRDGFYGFDPRSGAAQLLAGVESDLGDNRLNDAKCDRKGRLWGGTMADNESPGAGSFYRLDADGQLHLIWDRVTCSNGIGWSPDDRRMYYVDSGLRRVDRCDYDSTTGVVTNRAPFVEVPTASGEPDGLTVDAEGFVWVALWGGAAVHRYRPDGRLDRILHVPAINVTSCAFGGDDLGTLFITSAASKASPAQLSKYPLSGALFHCRPGVIGLPTNHFAG